MNRCLLTMGMTLLGLLLAGCGGGGGEVRAAEARWAAAGVQDYRLRLREIRSVWCLYDAEVEVQAGQVVSVTVTAQPGPARGCWDYVEDVLGEPVSVSPEEVPVYWTVPGLFELARRLEEQRGDKDMRIEMEFDPELGYPVRLFRDNEIAYDDELGLTVSELVTK